MYSVDPIGYFQASAVALYEVPRQGALLTNNEGIILLKKGFQFEQALEGLEGFDRIWILFRFHLHNHWKPKVLPPRGGKKQGVFATRSPHRPNHIGLSCVELREVRGLEIVIANHDLIDGTPILDIKPYLNYADSFTCAHQGWLDEIPPEPISLVFRWTALAQAQVDYLANHWNCHLQQAIEFRLSQSPFPYPNNRVKLFEKGFELSYRTWRIYYTLEDGLIVITHLKSGYDEETLAGKKTSKWDDVPIHQAFVEYFKRL